MEQAEGKPLSILILEAHSNHESIDIYLDNKIKYRLMHL